MNPIFWTKKEWGFILLNLVINGTNKVQNF